ncbi:rhodanese-like domain-containing protein [Ruegeria lacuscaerulensis]|uniref:rhodanese-like domain-containing protein n=1 Tax=Ruegeria lacuscaerulensis TaxID=55218 RepID=UPI00147BA31D|nr:rhodanese-like domain-containing protein [Ruegeria lacuscaerulensis]
MNTLRFPSRRSVLKMGAASALAAPALIASAAAGTETTIDPATLSDRQRTPLGLYMTPLEAYTALRHAPDIMFVDVRDPIEISFVGHPEGVDKIIPLGIVTHQIEPDSGQYRTVNNPNIVAEFDALLTSRGKTRDDAIIVTCRSGARSALASRRLIRAGYKNVWNLVEGFEGDKDANGVRSVNGWRNAGLPWGYRLEPGVAWVRPG